MDKIKAAKELLKIAKDLESYEFPNQKELVKYLHEHPAAKPKNHTVKRTPKRNRLPDQLRNPDKEKHEELRKKGELTFSYEATLAAVFISLYRDEPILRIPYTFLNSLKDIDETLTNWRSRHAQMVLRMIGKRVGTGGSSGHEYLRETAKKHEIFADLYNISTLLIPRSQLIPLPEDIRRKLGFSFQ